MKINHFIQYKNYAKSDYEQIYDNPGDTKNNVPLAAVFIYRIYFYIDSPK